MTVEQQIAALRNAIATGAMEVEYRSGETMRKVKYRSVEEMERVLSSLLNQSLGRKTTRRTVGVMVVR